MKKAPCGAFHVELNKSPFCDQSLGKLSRIFGREVPAATFTLDMLISFFMALPSGSVPVFSDNTSFVEPFVAATAVSFPSF
ncbi:MAG: hypothetical protein Q8930_16370 [Bacillota bacterium]|nr:hypothetical protein [Bacillota bacterium]